MICNFITNLERGVVSGFSYKVNLFVFLLNGFILNPCFVFGSWWEIGCTSP